MKPETRASLRSAFRMTLPVMAGYIFLGLTFGLLARTTGFAWWVPALMSLVIYSGALEFAAVPLLSAAFDPLGAFLLGVTLSARHLFYGVSMLRKYDGAGAVKPFLIFGLTDETFSILSAAEAPAGVSFRTYSIFVTLFDYAYWVTGTVLGTLIGSAVHVDLEGLDFVLTALFVVLFLEQLRTGSGRKSGFAGLIVCALALLLVGPARFIPVAMVLMVAVLLLGRRWMDRD